MQELLYLLLFLTLGSLIWRIAARFTIIPWPSWLAFMLENPYMLIVSPSYKLVERLSLQPGMILADIGCGAGRVSIPAAKLLAPNGFVDAIDLQEGMIKKTQKRASKHQVKNIQFIKAEIQGHPLEKEKYDRACLVTVLGEIPDREKIISEIYNSLKSNGILSITEVIPDPFYQTQKQVTRLCHQAGFKTEKTFKGLLAYTINFIKT